MPASFRFHIRFLRSLLPPLTALNVSILVFSPAVLPQSVPPALESPPARPPQVGPDGQKFIGMPMFHDPAPYDIDDHPGFVQIFDGKSLAGWDADTSIWRVENGLMIGETLEKKPRGNNYIVYRGARTRDFDLKLQMKSKRAGAAGFNIEASQECRGHARSRRVNRRMISSL
jgi:hypothetical protein